ncbi:FAD-dependent monooxygenase [Seohaeicola zhoushanensis]
MSDLPIIIAGGGIGGLATACGLARKGVRSIVVEQAPQLGEIGAGIQIGPNAFHCFDYLGVGDEARAVAVYIDQLRLMDAQTAENITHIPLDEPFRKFYGNPYAVVHRADLHGVLLRYCEASPLVDIRTSHVVTGYEQDGTSVSLLVKDRDPIKGRLLIAAEGCARPSGRR